MKKHLTAESIYVPDTTIHELNGQHVVNISELKSWLEDNTPWLSADDAGELAASLTHAASRTREWKEFWFGALDGSDQD